MSCVSKSRLFPPTTNISTQVQLQYDMKCQFEIGSPVVIHRHSERTDEPSVRRQPTTAAMNTTNTNKKTTKSGVSSNGDTTLSQTFGSGTKFTVTRVMEASDPIACAGNGHTATSTGSNSNRTSSHDTTAATVAGADDTLDEPCSSLDSSTSDSFKHIDLDTAPKRFGAKNRLISVDSGFESIGKMRVIGGVADADTTLAEDPVAIDEEGGDILEALRSEDSRLNNNDDATAAGDTAICDTRRKPGAVPVVKKNRTTTVNTTVEEPLLDPMLINKSDGLQDVLYYIDENGSPKIREKFSKKSKKGGHSESKKKKQLTYGTEADIADSYAFDEKTPSCVNFSRICKRFKNSFRKWLSYYRR